MYLIAYRSIRSLRLLAMLTLLFTASLSLADAEPRLKGLVFAQLTAEHFDNNGGLDFDAGAIRLVGDYAVGRWSSRLALDLNAGDLGERRPGTLPNVVFDAYVAYALDERHRIRFGQFKTPLGMDFSLSGHALTIAKRGMEKGLVLERDLGVMLSRRADGEGFGYDIGVFNIAGRSSATDYLDSQQGDAHAWVGRILFDQGPWHVESAYGISEEAGGPGSEDLKVATLGARYQTGPWSLAAEWTDGSGVRGDPDRDEQVTYAHLGYRLSPKLELVARHYAGASDIGDVSTSLGNSYIGASWHFVDEAALAVRLQANYLIVGGDDDYSGVRAFRADAALLQLQWMIRR